MEGKKREGGGKGKGSGKEREGKGKRNLPPHKCRSGYATA